MVKRISILAAMFVLVFSAMAHAEGPADIDKPVPTKIVVRVLSHGAKAMNEHTGAVVVIWDAETGKELDRGMAQGSTGDDTALMKTGYPRIRGNIGLAKGDKGLLLKDLKAADKAKDKGWMQPEPYYDVRDDRKKEELEPVVYESPVDAAKFETTLSLTKPTMLNIEAYGPLMPPHSTVSTMVKVLVLPGEDVTGDGIVLELRGLIVDAKASLKNKELMADNVKDGITVPFYMNMLCGCPITPGGKLGIPWEAEGFKITTQAYYKGKLYYNDVKTADKLYENVSSFVTKVPLPKDLPAGVYKKEMVKIRILAAQPEQANYGMDEFSVYLSK
jgi:hypothetical protein